MLSFSYKLPVFARLLPRTPSVLVYHRVPRATRRSGVDAMTFEQHIVFLPRRFTFVHPQPVYRRRASGRPADVLLTFDDGFRNNPQAAAPLFRRHGGTAVVF